MNKKERYDSINGLRTIACIGIILTHIRINIGYPLTGEFSVKVINQFANFVFLFMVISAFVMCCGYYNKIKNNEISPEKFYSKRINKIYPFFLFLVIIDIVFEHNLSSLIEGFTDITLLFSFLSKNIEVIGVAWFLGLVFIFYLMFPFFTYLFGNKKRAWFVTLISLLMSLSCIYYFDVGRKNMFYSFLFFCIGGLIYLYKDNIIKIFNKTRIIGIVVLITSIILYYTLPISNEYILLLRASIISISLLCYSISYNSKLLNNKITNFIGNISFEIYLCHMLIFRLIEKMKITNLFGNNWISYITTSLLVIIGSIVFSMAFKLLYSTIEKGLNKNENRHYRT